MLSLINNRTSLLYGKCTGLCIAFCISIIIGSLLIAPACLYASSSMTQLPTDALSHLRALDTRAIDSEISKNSEMSSFGFLDMLNNIISGELDLSLSAIADTIADSLLAEMERHLVLMRSILLIAVLSAVLKLLTSSNSDGVGALAFYICYMALVIILFDSFHIISGIATSLVDMLCEFMQAMLPLVVTVLIGSGNVGFAAVFHPLLLFTVDSISFLIKYILLPVTYLTATLEILNYLTEKDMLKNFAKLLSGGIAWVLKGFGLLFCSVLAFQKITAPMAQNVAVKSAKSVMEAVPVVGDAFAGAVDSVLYWGNAVKNGAAVALIIFVIIGCAVPILKIVALLIMYKLTAALIQPVVDKRIVECIDSAGSYAVLVLSLVVTVAVMFIFSLMILIGNVQV